PISSGGKGREANMGGETLRGLLEKKKLFKKQKKKKKEATPSSVGVFFFFPPGGVSGWVLSFFRFLGGRPFPAYKK
ncbi:hypothetical protein ACNIS2_25690, partial [Escherichia coli]